jgi:hypothetical protein
MDPKTQIKSAIQVSQREETFPVQEQELFPVRDLSNRAAAHILAEQLADQQASLAIAAPVFVP